MRTFIALLMATLLISCGEPKELLPHEELAVAGERLAKGNAKAFFLLREAREAFWPDNPKLQTALEINEQTVECIKKTTLPDSYYKERSRKDRVAPDSYFINEMTKAANGESDCYDWHNEQISALLGK